MESAKDPKVKWDRFYRGWEIIAGHIGVLGNTISNDSNLNALYYTTFKDNLFEFNSVIRNLSEGYARFWFKPKYGHGKNHDVVYKLPQDNDSHLVIKRRYEALFELDKRDEAGTWVRVDWTL